MPVEACLTLGWSSNLQQQRKSKFLQRSYAQEYLSAESIILCCLSKVKVLLDRRLSQHRCGADGIATYSEARRQRFEVLEKQDEVCYAILKWIL
jgi:hypothetical protein